MSNCYLLLLRRYQAITAQQILGCHTERYESDIALGLVPFTTIFTHLAGCVKWT